MRILVISDDTTFTKMARSSENIIGMQTTIFNQRTNLLNVFALVYENNTSLLIIDEDYLTPNAVQTLDTIQKDHNKLAIVFITSNSSIELSKKINQLGIDYYAIKPVDESEFKELLDSMLNK